MANGLCATTPGWRFLLRLVNAARILLLIELTRRLHQAYRFAYDKQAADWLLPQNPPRDSTLTNSETEQLRTDLATLLKDQKCAQFVRNVLMQINAVTGTAAYSNNILDIFDAVRKQGGFGRHAGAFTAEAANGVGSGKAFVNINYNIAANSSRIFNSASSGRTSR